MSAQLFVVSAPSGTGKSTIISSLGEDIDGLVYSISHTSRRPRSTETDGVDYHFVDETTFRKMIESGAFVEWAKVYHDYYGTSLASIDEQISLGDDILLDLDIQGAENIKRHFKNCVRVYILPPSLEVLEKRLRARGTDDEDVIRMRMEKASHEIRNCLLYDYIIINDDLEKAIEKTRAIIISSRCRTALRAGELKMRFNISSP